MRQLLSKDQILASMLPLQARLIPLTMKANKLEEMGNLQEAGKVYQELNSVSQQYLELALMNNQLYPSSPFDINPIINPMLDHMMVYADLLESEGNFNSARDLRNNANELATKYNVQTTRGSRSIDVTRQQAVSLTARGEFNAGISMYLEARDYYKQRKEPVGMAEVTAEMVDALEWLGDYDRALSEIDFALDMIEPLMPKQDLTAENIFSSFFNGQFEQASRNATLLKIYSQLLQAKARLERYLGNYDESAKIFQKVYKSMPIGGQPALDFQFAMILIGQKNFQQGLEILNRIEPAFRSGIYRQKLGAILAYQAEAYLALNQPERALKLANQAIPDLASYNDLDMLWRAQYRLGRALEAIGRNSEALKAFIDAGETINRLRKTPLSYRLDSTYLRDKMPVFEKAISIAAENGQAEICCQLIEKIKSRALTATLAVTREVRSESSPQDKAFNELSRQMDTLEYKGYMNGWSKDLQIQFDKLLNQRIDLLEKIHIADPRWRSVSEPVPFDLERLTSLLKRRNQAAFNLFYQPDKIIAILLMNGQASVQCQVLQPEIGNIINSYIKNLQANSPRPELFDPGKAGLSIDSIIPDDLLRQAIKAQSLVVIPHGPLHLLPWAGLSLDNKYLFEYCPVGILPNLTSLLLLENEFVTRPKIALIGGPDYSAFPYLSPLLNSEDELQTIQDIYSTAGGQIGDLAMGLNATESAFWSLARHADSGKGILHVCCHGNFVQGDPLNAGLLMSDAKVDAAEIAQSRILYDEVILSACSTGYRPTQVDGLVLTGDDILGLPGAFLEAGARSILVSIPPVRDDIALQFMTIYHEKRAGGISPILALRSTQLTMFKDKLFDPSLWMGFTVYGFQ